MEDLFGDGPQSEHNVFFFNLHNNPIILNLQMKKPNLRG